MPRESRFVPVRRSLTPVSHATPPHHHPDDLQVDSSGFGQNKAVRLLLRFWWILAILAGLLLFGWYATHPGDLHSDDSTVTESVKAGQTIYLALDSGDDDRTITVRNVEVHVDGPGKGAVEGVTIEALACSGGSLAVTTGQAPGCDGTEAKGEQIDFGEGEQLVIAITADHATELTVDQVEVSYRSGLQWATQQLGGSYEITVLE